MSLFNGNGGGDNSSARAVILGVYRAVLTAAVIGIGAALWQASHTLTSLEATVSTRLKEHDRELDRLDGRVQWLERLRNGNRERPY